MRPEGKTLAVASFSKTPRLAKLGVLGVGLLGGGGFATYTAYARPPDGFVPRGVRVAGMDWSNKSANTAKSELHGWVKTRGAEPLPLIVTLPSGKTRSFQPTRADLGADVDVDSTVREATSARDQESPFTRMANWLGDPKPVQVTPKWSLKADRARQYLEKQVAPIVRRSPKDARFLATKDSFKIVPEEPGVKLDTAEALKRIESGLQTETADPIALPLVTAAPHVSSADLKGIESEVSRYRTEYGETGNRARNIATACSRINGTVLKPGDIFSYNKVVGPRETSAGFRLAPVIIHGKLEPGLGGGVCQTSSTLYNAVLMAGLKIVRRSHHAFPVHYLPAGRDATVAYGSIDFQFQNDTDAPIAVASDGTGGRVLMRIFGKKVPGREIHIERTNVSSWDPPTEVVTDRSLPAGRRHTVDSGHAGHRVKVWRIVKLNGQVTKRELVSSDHYDSFPRVVVVGAGASLRKPAAKAPSAAAPTTQAPPAAGATGPSRS